MKKKTKIDYTLEQFLHEHKRDRQTIQTLTKITNVLDKIDRRLTKLEKKYGKR